MIMKTLICVVVAIVGTSCHAQIGSQYEWRATLRVVDDKDEPVAGARVWVAFGNPEDGQSPDPFQTNNWAIAGLSDSHGAFVASHHDKSINLGLHAQKTGYW